MFGRHDKKYHSVRSITINEITRQLGFKVVVILIL